MDAASSPGSWRPAIVRAKIAGVKVLGIDEAGRGCVLGDLVIAGFLVHDPDENTLRGAGAADSKAVPAGRRAGCCAELGAFGHVEIRRIDPPTIDRGNLNALEESAIIEIIRACEPDVVLLDALGHPNTLGRVRQRLLAGLAADQQPEITIEPKADVSYAVVGAASLFAKTTRDGVLDEWRTTFGDFGSGYPSDPKTRAWLLAWAQTGRPWPTFVRSRWATVETLAQQTLFPSPTTLPKPSPRRKAGRATKTSEDLPSK